MGNHGTATRRACALLPVLLAACAADTGLGTTDRAIIGGQPVTGDDLPTVGAIQTNVGTICTGTLISPTVVLTAAHCVEPMILKAAAQQAGETPPATISYQFTFARDVTAIGDADLLEVDSVEWHDHFLGDLDDIFSPPPAQWDDIAIMHLAEPVTGGSVQQLAPSDVVEALELDRMYAVAGYGLTSNDDPASAGVLTRGQSGLDELGAHEILAGDGDAQQACRGDSGGPIFAADDDTFQIGIASRINANLFPPPTEPPPCETGLVYTRIDPYLPWLAEHVGDLGEQPEGGDDDDGDGDGDDNGDGNDGGCTAAGAASGRIGTLALLVAIALVMRRRRRGR